MLEIINFFNFGTDPKGLAEVSAVLTVVVLLFVVVVGLLLDLIANVELRGLRRFFGDRVAVNFFNYWTFPGLLMHELAHALVAIFTGARVLEFHLFDKDGDSLGHVTYQNRGLIIMRAVQDTFIACAPVVAGIVLGVVVLWHIFCENHAVWVDVLLWYLFVSIVNHASMSRQDLKNYFGGVWIFVLPVFGVFYLFAQRSVNF